jgi:RNA polymerase sigma-70 factor (ECF subfamily)
VAGTDIPFRHSFFSQRCALEQDWQGADTQLVIGPQHDSSKSNGHERFVTTHWSVVLKAGWSDSTQGRAALETVCRTYWYPLYAFVRRLGHSPPDAEDLVQAFFERCLEKRYLAAANQAKGRFRSFLLLALKRFLANEWDKARSRKRGGGQIPLALDALSPEERYAQEPANHCSPDKLFERRWALALLENVLARLRSEHVASGRLAVFQELKGSLAASGCSAPYAEIGLRLGMSEGAVKVAIHRLRQRYRELLEDEIAQTVSSQEEIAEERRYLLAVLGQ